MFSIVLNVFYCFKKSQDDFSLNLCHMSKFIHKISGHKKCKIQFKSK